MGCFAEMVSGLTWMVVFPFAAAAAVENPA